MDTDQLVRAAVMDFLGDGDFLIDAIIIFTTKDENGHDSLSIRTTGTLPLWTVRGILAEAEDLFLQAEAR